MHRGKDEEEAGGRGRELHLRPQPPEARCSKHEGSEWCISSRCRNTTWLYFESQLCTSGHFSEAQAAMEAASEEIDAPKECTMPCRMTRHEAVKTRCNI